MRLHFEWVNKPIQFDLSVMAIVKGDFELTLDLALMAMCNTVSPSLSVAVTRAFLSSSNCTNSRLRLRTAFSKGVSPSCSLIHSWNTIKVNGCIIIMNTLLAISKFGSAFSNDLTTATWFFSTAQYKAVFLSFVRQLVEYMFSNGNSMLWLYLSSHIDINVLLEQGLDDRFMTGFSSINQIGISASILHGGSSHHCIRNKIGRSCRKYLEVHISSGVQQSGADVVRAFLARNGQGSAAIFIGRIDVSFLFQKLLDNLRTFFSRRYQQGSPAVLNKNGKNQISFNGSIHSRPTVTIPDTSTLAPASKSMSTISMWDFLQAHINAVVPYWKFKLNQIQFNSIKSNSFRNGCCFIGLIYLG